MYSNNSSSSGSTAIPPASYCSSSAAQKYAGFYSKAGNMLAHDRVVTTLSKRGPCSMSEYRLWSPKHQSHLYQGVMASKYEKEAGGRTHH